METGNEVIRLLERYACEHDRIRSESHDPADRAELRDMARKAAAGALQDERHDCEVVRRALFIAVATRENAEASRLARQLMCLSQEEEIPFGE